VELFRDEGRFGDAQTHLEQAKSHAVNNAYHLGRATELQAEVYRQHRLEEAESELCVQSTFSTSLGLQRM